METIGPYIKESISGITYKEEIRNSIKGQVDMSLIAYMGLDVVGSVDFSLWRNDLSIQMIYVNPDFRKQGIGLELLRRLQKMYPENYFDFGMTTVEGERLVKQFLQKYPQKVDRQKGFSDKDFVLSFHPEFGKNGNWHTYSINRAFQVIGVDIRDDWSWQPDIDKYKKTIKSTSKQKWATAADILRRDYGLRNNAEMK